jgi:hypothetical protein
MAYNQMKERKLMLEGVGFTNAEATRKKLIKCLMDTSYSLQVQAVRSLVEFLAHGRRGDKERERILKRFLNSSLREMGCALRMLRVNKEDEEERERALFLKQRGVCKRMVDVNARLLGMGFNKLLEEHKIRMNALKEKLKFVLQTLGDKDKRFMFIAYNQMKERKLMLDGVGFTSAEAGKKKLIRSLMDKGYSMQCQAINGLKEFLKKEKSLDKEKDRILKRMLYQNIREMGQALRMLEVNKEQEEAREISIAQQQRGICKRILDVNTRLMGMGYNKL